MFMLWPSLETAEQIDDSNEWMNEPKIQFAPNLKCLLSLFHKPQSNQQ